MSAQAAVRFDITHPAWPAAWAGLAECYGFDVRPPDGCTECNERSGECWQLMGTYPVHDDGGGAELVCEFRHRDHPRHGRIYRRVKLARGRLGWTWLR